MERVYVNKDVMDWIVVAFGKCKWLENVSYGSKEITNERWKECRNRKRTFYMEYRVEAIKSPCLHLSNWRNSAKRTFWTWNVQLIEHTFALNYCVSPQNVHVPCKLVRQTVTKDGRRARDRKWNQRVLKPLQSPKIGWRTWTSTSE